MAAFVWRRPPPALTPSDSLEHFIFLVLTQDDTSCDTDLVSQHDMRLQGGCLRTFPSGRSQDRRPKFCDHQEPRRLQPIHVDSVLTGTPLAISCLLWYDGNHNNSRATIGTTLTPACVLAMEMVLSVDPLAKRKDANCSTCLRHRNNCISEDLN